MTRKEKTCLRTIKYTIDSQLQNFKIYTLLENKRNLIKIGQVRELLASYPIFFIIIEKEKGREMNIYKCIVATEDVEIGYTKDSPLIRINERKTIIVVLPFWIYLTEEFLLKHSTLVEEIKNKSEINP